MIKAILFDWDRTLAQTAIEKTFIALALTIKYRANPFKVIYNYFNSGGASTFEIIKNSINKINEEKLKKDYTSLFRKLSWMTWLSDKKIFDDLKNMKIGIVTNDLRENVEFYLDGKGYDVLIGYKDCKNRKPSAEPIELALNKLDIKPSEAIYVGYSRVDIIAANNAHVKSVGFGLKAMKLKKLGAWKIIYSLNSLRKII